MLPVFVNEKSSTRDKIISILVSHSGENTKKINSILKKQFSLNVTYQAIHKTLKQMVEEGIIKYENKGYIISKLWIESLSQFISQIKSVSESKSKESTHYIISPTLETIECDTFQEMLKYFFQFREEYFNKIDSIPFDKRIICYHGPHMQVAINQPRAEYEFMDRLEQNKTQVFCLIKGKTLVDKWNERFYNSQKTQSYLVKTGANCSSISEVWIYPDKLVEIFFSDKLWTYFNDLYINIKKIEDINFSKVIEKLYEYNDVPIKILVHKDKSIINLGIKETLKQFENDIKKPQFKKWAKLLN